MRNVADRRPLRLATPSDLPELLGLVREFCAVDHRDFDEARVRDALVPLLESGGADALLDEIYVRERRRGRGSELLRHIMQDLESRGLSRIFLETERHNEAVRRFYARHGFEEESSIWMCKGVGWGRADRIDR